ncbi:MAG: tetratricopeptide repeat protein [Bacteroidota bacterium]
MKIIFIGSLAFALVSSCAYNKSESKKIIDKSDNEIVSCPPTDDSCFFNSGLEAFMNKNYLQAVHFFTKTIEINPTFSTAVYNRSHAYYELCDEKNQEIDLRKTILLDTTYAEAYFYLGELLKKNGNFNEAIINYEKSLKYNYPYPSEVKVSIARTYLALGDSKKALGIINNLINQYPKMGVFLFERGTFFLALNNKKTACSDFHESMKAGYLSKTKYIDSICGGNR